MKVAKIEINFFIFIWGYGPFSCATLKCDSMVYRVMQKNAPTFETLPFPQSFHKTHENSEFDIEIWFWSSSKKYIDFGALLIELYNF